MVDRDFWRGKRILITGHTGFKGGWLSLWLEKLGAEITGLALAPATEPALFTVARVGQEIQSHLADIRDLPAVQQIFAKAQPEIVFHLAALPLVRASYQNPIGTYATNIMGTAHVLEALRHTPSARAAVIVTSDKCYENRERLEPYREDDAMGGFDPYSSSKGAAELITAAYRRSYFSSGVAVASARAGNVIGGGDWSADRLLPDLVRAAGAGETTVIRNPDAIRPWQHVLDPLQGYLQLAEVLYRHGQAYAEGWNFGPDATQAASVGKLAQCFVEAWGPPADFRMETLPGQPHEARFLNLDSTKAHDRLNWQPRWPWRASVENTCAWYRAHLSGSDMRAFSLAQIDSFERSTS